MIEYILNHSWTLLGSVVAISSAILGIIFLFIDIKGKKGVSLRTAVLIVLGIIIFSAILTIVNFYQEQSGTNDSQKIDVSEAVNASAGTQSSDKNSTTQSGLQNIKPEDSQIAEDGTGNQSENFTSSGETDTDADDGNDTIKEHQSIDAGIYQKPMILVEKVTLDYQGLNLTVGDRKTLTAVVLYSDNSIGKEVIWSSSNPKVASVDSDGTITAHSAGTAEITAQASKNNVAKFGTCQIEVADPVTTPTGYSIRLSTDHAMIGETFIVYVTPDGEKDSTAQIQLYTISPSGEEDNFPLSQTGKYCIDTEVGVWTIYASVTNDAGTYYAQEEDDYVTIKIVSIEDAIGNLLGGMM